MASPLGSTAVVPYQSPEKDQDQSLLLRTVDKKGDVIRTISSFLPPKDVILGFGLTCQKVQDCLTPEHFSSRLSLPVAPGVCVPLGYPFPVLHEDEKMKLLEKHASRQGELVQAFERSLDSPPVDAFKRMQATVLALGPENIPRVLPALLSQEEIPADLGLGDLSEGQQIAAREFVQAGRKIKERTLAVLRAYQSLGRGVECQETVFDRLVPFMQKVLMSTSIDELSTFGQAINHAQLGNDVPLAFKEIIFENKLDFAIDHTNLTDEEKRKCKQIASSFIEAVREEAARAYVGNKGSGPLQLLLKPLRAQFGELIDTLKVTVGKEALPDSLVQSFINFIGNHQEEVQAFLKAPSLDLVDELLARFMGGLSAEEQAIAQASPLFQNREARRKFLENVQKFASCFVSTLLYLESQRSLIKEELNTLAESSQQFYDWLGKVFPLNEKSIEVAKVLFSFLTPEYFIVDKVMQSPEKLLSLVLERVKDNAGEKSLREFIGFLIRSGLYRRESIEGSLKETLFKPCSLRAQLIRLGFNHFSGFGNDDWRCNKCQDRDRQPSLLSLLSDPDERLDLAASNLRDVRGVEQWISGASLAKVEQVIQDASKQAICEHYDERTEPINNIFSRVLGRSDADQLSARTFQLMRYELLNTQRTKEGLALLGRINSQLEGKESKAKRIAMRVWEKTPDRLRLMNFRRVRDGGVALVGGTALAALGYSIAVTNPNEARAVLSRLFGNATASFL